MLAYKHDPARWTPAGHLTAKWLPRDGGRPPQCPADPAYPNGMDVDSAGPETLGCAVALPLVDNRIGLYIVECSKCGTRVAITVAGRADDARLARIECKVADPSGRQAISPEEKDNGD